MLGLNWPRELGMFVSQAGIPPVRPGRRGTTPPLGLEAKSLKNGMTPHWIFQGPHTYPFNGTGITLFSHYRAVLADSAHFHKSVR